MMVFGFDPRQLSFDFLVGFFGPCHLIIFWSLSFDSFRLFIGPYHMMVFGLVPGSYHLIFWLDLMFLNSRLSIIFISVPTVSTFYHFHIGSYCLSFPYRFLYIWLSVWTFGSWLRPEKCYRQRRYSNYLLVCSFIICCFMSNSVPALNNSLSVPARLFSFSSWVIQFPRVCFLSVFFLNNSLHE